MKQVKFVYSTISHEEKPHIFIVYKNVDEKESLRNITIDIIKEAVDKGYGLPAIKDGINPKSGLQITTNMDEISKLVSDRVYLMENGEVHFLTFYESLRKNWTLEELDKLNSKRFLIGNISTIYIAYPFGLGTGFIPDYFGILATSIINGFIEVGVKALFEHSFQKNKEFLSRKEIKDTVKKWIDFNGVSETKQIRKFIEKKRELESPKIV